MLSLPLLALGAPSRPEPIILIADVGVDDAAAVLLALASPRVRVTPELSPRPKSRSRQKLSRDCRMIENGGLSVDLKPFQVQQLQFLQAYDDCP